MIQSPTLTRSQPPPRPEPPAPPQAPLPLTPRPQHQTNPPPHPPLLPSPLQNPLQLAKLLPAHLLDHNVRVVALQVINHPIEIDPRRAETRVRYFLDLYDFVRGGHGREGEVVGGVREGRGGERGGVAGRRVVLGDVFGGIFGRGRGGGGAVDRVAVVGGEHHGLGRVPVDALDGDPLPGRERQVVEPRLQHLHLLRRRGLALALPPRGRPLRQRGVENTLRLARGIHEEEPDAHRPRRQGAPRLEHVRAGGEHLVRRLDKVHGVCDCGRVEGAGGLAGEAVGGVTDEEGDFGEVGGVHGARWDDGGEGGHGRAGYAEGDGGRPDGVEVAG